MKGYVSIDEMITIAESKIRGSIFEILGTEKFLQRVLDNAEIEPVFYFSGYGVLQAFVENKFYSTASCTAAKHILPYSLPKKTQQPRIFKFLSNALRGEETYTTRDVESAPHMADLNSENAGVPRS